MRLPARYNHQLLSSLPLFTLGIAVVAALMLVTCAKTSMTTIQPTNQMATIQVSLSDPPTCSAPAGNFRSVFITIRSVQAHISATAGDNSPGWVELVPELNAHPVQVDLLNLPANGACLLTTLGSNMSLPPGDYQQIRLLLVDDNPSGGAMPATNSCATLGQVFNCVISGQNSVSELQLSSQTNTGLKIPPGQVVGGPIHVGAGQAVDINIDFNACASVIQQGNGMFRLKPTLTAGVVSTNTTGIKGQVVDSVTMKPIVGAMAALEKPDSGGTDRIFMEALTDANGQFSFCPLPVGAVFDVAVDAVSSAGTAYNATIVVNVPGGTDVGALPLVAETGTVVGPAKIQGIVTALNGTTGANVDVVTSALQSVSISGGMTVSVTIPLLGGSSPNVAVEFTTACPASGSPTGAFCAQYTLVVPPSNPEVGSFAAGKITFSPPASSDVLFSVEADATKAMSGGTPICTMPSQTVTTDSNGANLKVTPGATVTAKEIDFSGCA
ncbi:MAG: DUF4382 domain-containing protein [Candidatus Acidiferrum sp.]